MKKEYVSPEFEIKLFEFTDSIASELGDIGGGDDNEVNGFKNNDLLE